MTLGSVGNDLESGDTFHECSVAVESGTFIRCRLQNLRPLGVAPRISAAYILRISAAYILVIILELSPLLFSGVS